MQKFCFSGMNILVVCNHHVQAYTVMFVSKDFLEMPFFWFFFGGGGLVHTEVNPLPWNIISRTKERRSGLGRIYIMRYLSQLH